LGNRDRLIADSRQLNFVLVSTASSKAAGAAGQIVTLRSQAGSFAAPAHGRYWLIVVRPR
jgi:hypothetical protein